MTVITHVPTLGDAYRATNSSAIITVIRGLAGAHRARGGQTRVLVSDRTDNDSGPEVVPLPIGPRVRWLEQADRASTALVGRRPGYERRLAAGIRSWLPGAQGPLFLHNQPAAGNVLRGRPAGNVFAYLHNDVLARLTKRAGRMLMRRFDGIVCVSHYLADRVESQVGAGAPPITVAHNGVDTSSFPPHARGAAEEVLRVGYLGRLNHDKAPDLLLRAAGLTGRVARPIEIVMIGGSYHGSSAVARYERDLREQASRSTVRVEMLGRQPATSVPALLATLDVLVVPSRWQEPCSLVLLEGAAAGAAVLGSRTGGTPELLGDELTFQPDDARTLADRLAAYAGSPELLLRDQEKCRRIAAERPWSRTLESVLKATGAAG